MKKKLICALLSLVLLSTVFSSCNLKNAIDVLNKQRTESELLKQIDDKIICGTYSKNVYKNSWLKIKITLPDNFKFLGKKEIEKLQNTKTTKVNTGKESKKIDFSKKNSLVDMMVYFPDKKGSLTILIQGSENPDPVLDDLSESTYIELIKEGIAKNNDWQYKESSDVSIGGKNCVRASFVDYKRESYLDYLVFKQDKVYISLMFSYTEKTKSDMNKLLKTIKPMK